MSVEIKDYTQNADSIKILSERDKIRKKISVYAGSSTSEALQVLLREPVDNSIDEFSYHKENIKDSNFDKIKIEIDTKKIFATIRDYGRGIPYVKDKNGLSTLEKTLTILHAGGKHENDSNFLLSENLNENKKNYQFSSGINGLGITLCTYASSIFYAVVYNDEKKEKAFMTFKDGFIENQAEIIPINKNLDFLEEKYNKDLKTGTLICFSPSIKKDDFDDENIFDPESNFNKEEIINQLKILPYLNPGLEIELIYDNELIIFKKEEVFSNALNVENKSKLIFKNNFYATEYMVLGQNRDTNNKKVFSLEEFLQMNYNERKNYKVKSSIFELSFNFIQENKQAFQENVVNGTIRIKGGKQDIVWKNQIKKIINDYISENQTLNKKIGLLETDDIVSSLTFLFMVKINNPSFEGQTKNKLNNTELISFGNYFFSKYLKNWLNREDEKSKDKLFKVLEANKKSRLKANLIKDNVFKEVISNNDNSLLLNTSKLSKCKSNNPELCELFLVEGNSAAGPCKESRVSLYQSILALRGKVLNVLKVKKENKILENEELVNLITALGCKIDKNFDYSKLNYKKVCILTDKDTDGLHIRNLLLVFFYKYFPKLLEEGNIYIVDAPLYAIKTKNKIYYAWSLEEREKISKKLKIKYEITRFKGLGEMNSSQLYETCLDKENRKLIQVKLNDFKLIKNSTEEELEELIYVYMGDKTKKRDELITEYYQQERTPYFDFELPLK